MRRQQLSYRTRERRTEPRLELTTLQLDTECRVLFEGHEPPGVQTHAGYTSRNFMLLALTAPCRNLD